MSDTEKLLVGILYVDMQIALLEMFRDFSLVSTAHKHTLRFKALPDSWLLYTETHTQTHAGSKLNVTKPVS